MGKKPMVKMSMAECTSKFGGDPNAGRLPTQSEGKDFGKSKGRGGFRDNEDREQMNDFGRKGGGKGFGQRDGPSSGPSDWGRGGGDAGGSNLRVDRRGSADAPAEKDGDWRGGGGRDDERRGGGKGGDRDGGKGGDRDGGKGFGDRGGDRDGGFGGGGPGTRQRLKLQPRSTPMPNQSPEHAAEDRKRQEEASKRQHMQSQDQRAKESKARAEEQKKQQEAEVLAAIERAKKKEEKDRKQAENNALKEAIRAGKSVCGKGNKNDPVDAIKLNEFGERVKELVDDAKASVKGLVKDLADALVTGDLESPRPLRVALAPLMAYCRQKQPADVDKIIDRFAPLLVSLVEFGNGHRFKVKLLGEVQRAVQKMGFPRLSADTALLEAVFDALYKAEVVEEEYFAWWAEADDDVPGKINAMFQVSDFLEWLKDPSAFDKPESEDEDEGEEEEEEDAEDDDEEDDSDIEANVPVARR